MARLLGIVSKMTWLDERLLLFEWAGEEWDERGRGGKRLPSYFNNSYIIYEMILPSSSVLTNALFDKAPSPLIVNANTLMKYNVNLSRLQSSVNVTWVVTLLKVLFPSFPLLYNTRYPSTIPCVKLCGTGFHLTIKLVELVLCVRMSLGGRLGTIGL